MAKEISTSAPARYGIYFAPEPRSSLWQRGSHWLGRDAERDIAIAQPKLPHKARIDIAALTKSARFYGFHATLKAPFHLSSNSNEDDFLDALHALASSLTAFEMAPLSVQALHGFLCLRTTESSTELQHLADCCVRDLDQFRAPLSADDIARRKRTPLTQRQLLLLERWGYPYVFDEYRFHMTLTARIDDVATMATLKSFLTKFFAPFTRTPVTELVLFKQVNRDSAFTVLKRFPLKE